MYSVSLFHFFIKCTVRELKKVYIVHSYCDIFHFSTYSYSTTKLRVDLFPDWYNSHCPLPPHFFQKLQACLFDLSDEHLHKVIYWFLSHAVHHAICWQTANAHKTLSIVHTVYGKLYWLDFKMNSLVFEHVV